MIEALWSVEFSSTMGAYGGGVAVFETGRVLGGDAGYTYIGNYSVESDQVSGVLKITNYNPAIVSVFGPSKEFELVVRGPIGRDKMRLHGSVKGNPQLQIVIQATRRAELP